MQFLVHLFGGNPRLKQGMPRCILQLTKIRIEQIRRIELEVEEKAIDGMNADLRGPSSGPVSGQGEGGSSANRTNGFEMTEVEGGLVPL